MPRLEALLQITPIKWKITADSTNFVKKLNRLAEEATRKQPKRRESEEPRQKELMVAKKRTRSANNKEGS